MGTLEVCVDSADGLAQAVAGGADRIELCAALELGGLTPAPGLMGLAAETGVPIVALIRPRPGDFVYGPADLRAAFADIAAVQAMGLAGVVIGANLADGQLDKSALRAMVAAAAGLEIVLHRAVDLCPDPGEAVRIAADLGMDRILSSGGAAQAVDGLARLQDMQRAAAGQIAVLPGSGVTPENVRQIVRTLGVTQVHASCARNVVQSTLAVGLGFTGPMRKQTHVDEVARMKTALQAALAAS